MVILRNIYKYVSVSYVKYIKLLQLKGVRTKVLERTGFKIFMIGANRTPHCNRENRIYLSGAWLVTLACAFFCIVRGICLRLL